MFRFSDQEKESMKYILRRTVDRHQTVDIYNCIIIAECSACHILLPVRMKIAETSATHLKPDSVMFIQVFPEFLRRVGMREKYR